MWWMLIRSRPAHVGQVYDRPSPLLTLDSNAFPGRWWRTTSTRTEDGTYLSGYAPIYDQFQELDGVLGIDIDAATVMASEARARRTALVAFLVAIPFSILTGWWLANRLTAPVTDLVHGVERVAQGDLDEPIPVHSRDELGVLATAFNQMTMRLKQTLGGLEQEIAERRAHPGRLAAPPPGADPAQPGDRGGQHHPGAERGVGNHLPGTGTGFRCGPGRGGHLE